MCQLRAISKSAHDLRDVHSVNQQPALPVTRVIVVSPLFVSVAVAFVRGGYSRWLVGLHRDLAPQLGGTSPLDCVVVTDYGRYFVFVTSFTLFEFLPFEMTIRGHAEGQRVYVYAPITVRRVTPHRRKLRGICALASLQGPVPHPTSVRNAA